MIVTTGGNTEDDGVDLAVEEEALERYYRRRIREVSEDDAPTRGTRGFVPVDDLRKLADEHPGVRPLRSG